MNGINNSILGGAASTAGLQGFPGVGETGFGSSVGQNLDSVIQALGMLTGLGGIGSGVFPQGPGAFGAGGGDPITQTLQSLNQFLGGGARKGHQKGDHKAGAHKAGAHNKNAAPAVGGANAAGAPSGAAAGTGAASGSAPAKDSKDEGEIKKFIGQAASAYGADASVLTKMAEGESGFKTDAVNDWDSNAKKGTPSQGLFQFIKPTFDDMSKKAKAAKPEAWKGMGEPNFGDWRHQALTAAWAIANGQGSAWATYAGAGGK